MSDVKRIYLYLCGGPGAKHRFTLGTYDDLKAAGIQPLRGLRLQFYCDDGDPSGKRDDLLFEGVVDYDDDRRNWCAVVDWDTIRHESDFGESSGHHDEGAKE